MAKMNVTHPKLMPLRDNLERIIFGKTECVDVSIVALLAEGSMLIEDVPGVGKTTLAKALARSIEADYSRIQFTPDLLPADILGSSIYNPVTGDFKFSSGAIFCNILLADEINRASPRTQSALLEAMNETQVTIEGTCHPLPHPFMVLATQNPVESHGTFPLPEAQLDRFLIQLDLGYPTMEVEIDILQSHSHQDPLTALTPVLRLDDIRAFQQELKNIHIDTSLLEYIVEIVHRTRRDSRLQLGISPRGSLMLTRAAQASAFTQERDYVTPDDILWMAPYVLPHRLLLTSQSHYAGLTKKQIMEEIISLIKIPV